MNLPILTVAALLLGVLPAANPTAPQDPPAPPAGIPECKDSKKTASGLEYCVLAAGRAEAGPSSVDLCEVHYTGWLLDGTKFDSSRDRGEPAQFRANQVIKGWTEGLQLMTPGARFKFTIPPDLGYGAQGTGAIPANSTLVFDVELLRVVPAPKYRAAREAEQRTTESGVKYEVVKAGNGLQCGPNDGVALRYAIWNGKQELIDCSEWQNNHRLAGTLATMPFPFLKELAQVCRVGDVVRAEIPQKMFPNAQGDSVWELELTGISQVPQFRVCDPAKIVKTDSGLVYEVIEAGTGASPKATDTVVANYTGWLTDGTMFDSSHARGQPTEFPLNRVVKGWTEGLQLMRAGGKFLFQIPPELGYGTRGSPPKIPANATLVFLIELVEVKPSGAAGGR